MNSILKHSKLLLAIGLLSLGVGCSTKVNKFPNRAFHNTTTRFNIMFNGQQSFDEGVETLETAYITDYDSLIPLYIYPIDTNEVNTIKEQMERAIAKGEKSIIRHSMYIKKEERNKHIDDAYMLIGKGYLYQLNYIKAKEMFKYVSKAYKEKPEGTLGHIWFLKTLIEEEEYFDALDEIKKLNEAEDFPKEHLTELNKTIAHYFIQEREYKKAIEHLETALETAKEKEEKIQFNFLIGQLYDKLGNHSNASNYYTNVLDLKPDYDLMLNTKLKIASHYSNGSESEEELLSLLKKCPSGNEKSKIYLALADIQLKKEKKTKAVQYMKKAAGEAIDKKIKNKAYYKLANFNYSEKNYLTAKIYYDSTLTTMSSDNGLYSSVESKRNNLSRLVRNINTIQLQDSLITLALMSEDQRKEAINNQIQYNKDLLEAKKEKEKIQAARNNATVAPTITTSSSVTNKGNWYFENPSTMQYGRAEFRKVWGDIELTDHWRRKDRSTSAFSNTFDTEVEEEDIDNIDAYLENVPLSDEKMSLSISTLINAYYDIGIVYNEKLDAPENAITEGFSQVVNKYDTAKLAPPSAYFCYSIYYKMGEISKAEQYKNILINKYPDTEYAKIVQNPNYFADKKREADAVFPAYEKAYAAYKAEDFESSLSQINSAEQQYPENVLEPKFLLLKALVKKEQLNQQEFKINLQKIVDNYPKSEEFELANALLNNKSDAFFKSKEPVLNYNNLKDSLFLFDDTANYQFAIAIPLNGENKTEQIKGTIANFNNAKFKLDALNISDLLIKEDLILILVKSFEADKDKSIKYYKSFIGNKGQLKEINEKNFYAFIIGQENLSLLYKNKDLEQYNLFFKETFLK